MHWRSTRMPVWCCTSSCSPARLVSGGCRHIHTHQHGHYPGVWTNVCEVMHRLLHRGSFVLLHRMIMQSQVKKVCFRHLCSKLAVACLRSVGVSKACLKVACMAALRQDCFHGTSLCFNGKRLLKIIVLAMVAWHSIKVQYLSQMHQTM